MNAMKDDSSRGGVRKDLIWRICCCAVALAYLATIPRMWQCEGVDEIEYLGLAHSLERGEGYTLYGQPYTYYPPLYPWLLSHIMRFDTTAWTVMYGLNALAGLGGLLFLASWLRRTCGAAGRWAAWFALFSYYPWSFSTRYIMAEPVFVLLGSVALVQAARCLEAERAPRDASVLAPVFLLLTAMTKAATIALSAGLCMAVAVGALSRRRWSLLWLCAVLCVAGIGFGVAWEIRGARVDPNASETYLRWSKKFLGLSKEREGLIARDAGEGLEKPVGLPVRACVLGQKYGQYVCSFARVPANFSPAALFLWLVFLTGLAVRARKEPWSPLVWFTVLSLIMFSLTRWVSSYHRYLYALTPLLFLFLFEGAAAWKRALVDRQRKPAWLAVAAFGIAGILWTVSHGLASDVQAGAERAYVVAIGLACSVAYAVMAVGGLCACSGLGSWRVALPREGILAAALFVSAVHSAAIAAERFRHTLANEMLEARNLAGAVACGRWVRENTVPDTVIAVSLPRLMSFLADRTAVGPGPSAASVAILTGELRDVPAFRPEAEARLRDQVVAGQATPVFSSGDALVYRITHH